MMQLLSLNRQHTPQHQVHWLRLKARMAQPYNRKLAAALEREAQQLEQKARNAHG